MQRPRANKTRAAIKKEETSYLTQAYHYFFAVKKKHGRKKTIYAGNHTASLALPDVPKRAQPACKPRAAALPPLTPAPKLPEKTYTELAYDYASVIIAETPKVVIPAVNQAYLLLSSFITSTPLPTPNSADAPVTLTNASNPASMSQAPVITAPAPEKKPALTTNAKPKKPRVAKDDSSDSDSSYEDESAEESVVPSPPQPKSTQSQLKLTEKNSAANEKYDFTPHSIDELIAALSQTFKRVKEHSQKEAVLLEQIELLEFSIKEHAARRIDLIFYLMMAMYDRNISAEKIHTDKQHGEGTKKMALEGCHSCLFPSVKLSKPSTGFVADLASSAYDRLTANTYEDIMTRHLGESFNMTVEMISLVNDFDQFVEGHSTQGKVVKAILEICKKVSSNAIDPMEAMSEVLAVFREFFNHFSEQHLATNLAPKNKKTNDPKTRPEKVIKYKLAMRKVMEYEAVGTFDAANAAGKIDPNYIYMLLRLNPVEIAQVQQDPSALRTYYLRMRTEIYAHASTVQNANLTPGMKK